MYRSFILFLFCMCFINLFNFFAASSPHRLKVGDKIPHFVLSNQDGELVDIADYPRKGEYFILYFYPKDNTTGCTAQACSFNNIYTKLKDLNIDIIGISGDNEDSHRSFAGEYNLKFDLLSDVNTKGKSKVKTVRELFKLNAYSRTTYVIDKKKEIVFEFTSQIKIQSHISGVMEFLKSKKEKSEDLHEQSEHK